MPLNSAPKVNALLTAPWLGPERAAPRWHFDSRFCGGRWVPGGGHSCAPTYRWPQEERVVPGEHSGGTQGSVVMNTAPRVH